MSNFSIEINKYKIVITFGSVDPEFITDLVGDFVPFNSFPKTIRKNLGEPLDFVLTFRHWMDSPVLEIQVDYDKIHETEDCRDETIGYAFMSKLGSALVEFHELRNEVLDDPEERWFNDYKFSMDEFHEASAYIVALGDLYFEEYGPKDEGEDEEAEISSDDDEKVPFDESSSSDDD
jgi:hypothetical protein